MAVSAAVTLEWVCRHLWPAHGAQRGAVRLGHVGQRHPEAIRTHGAQGQRIRLVIVGDPDVPEPSGDSQEHRVLVGVPASRHVPLQATRGDLGNRDAHGLQLGHDEPPQPRPVVMVAGGAAEGGLLHDDQVGATAQAADAAGEQLQAGTAGEQVITLGAARAHGADGDGRLVGDGHAGGGEAQVQPDDSHAAPPALRRRGRR